MDLFTEIIKNSTNNKNVSTLVIEYLTDPPRLPFLDQLINTTSYLLSSTNKCIFYNNHYYIIRSGKFDLKVKFQKTNIGWMLLT